MQSTRFVEPSGLSPENRASARDLLLLMRHLALARTDILRLTDTPAHTIVSSKGRKIEVPNFNVFVAEPSFEGGKTGYTDDANQTMAALFEHDGGRYVIIVLGTKNRKADVEALRAWLNDAIAR
jgi:serine-type D-Ala-D-Ala endopeptidase (penicillin-binding protein 7)